MVTCQNWHKYYIFFYPAFLVRCILLKAAANFLTLQGFTPPNSAADQSIADDGSTLSLGAIVGVTIGAILIVFLVGHFIYRRHSTR